MKLPYQEPLVPIEPGERVIPEPPRRGEPGGEPCGICSGEATTAVWSDDYWTLHPPIGGSLPGTVWLASREHADSFSDLSAECASTFGIVAARVERAILSLGDVARVHLYRWGDGGSHFHVWFIPRPLGMLEAQGMMLPLWEDVLPTLPDEELREAAERVASALNAAAPTSAAPNSATPNSAAPNAAAPNSAAPNSAAPNVFEGLGALPGA